VPDAIVIEHPRYAGGHLGATRLEEVGDTLFDFARVLAGLRNVFQELDIAPDRVPLVPDGGINSFHRIAAMFELGASGVQIGTPFAVTEECDAHSNFKKVLAEAEPQDTVTFMSAAGLPARAVLTPWLKRYLAKEQRLRARARPDAEFTNCPSQVQCLAACAFKDGNPAAGQFCIETQLAAARRGSIEKGLFFRGSESLPFGTEIRSVAELLQRLLTDARNTIDSFVADATRNAGLSAAAAV
jgi:nitronate monooxygenase